MAMKMGKTIKLASWWYPSTVSVSSVWWFLYFTVLYFLPWIPARFNYTKEVVLGPLMVPWFVWTWVICNALTILGMFALYRHLASTGFFENNRD
jgi:hypothetical protein